MGREPGPHAVERLGHLGDAAEPLGQIVLLLLARPLLAGVDAAPGEPGPVVVGQGAHHLRFDEAPPRVVGARPAAGQGDDLLGRRGAQAQDARAERAPRRHGAAGRCRVRTARANTLTMRTSPLSLATAGSSTPRTRTSGTSPDTVERLTPVSPSEGSTCSM